MLWAVIAGLTAQLQLDWRAVPECPAEPAVRASVQRWLGREPDSPLSVTAVVVRDDERFSLTLDVEGRGVRKLEGGSCAELTEAGALVLALLLDPQLLTRPVPATPPPEVEVAFDVGVHGVADHGALPSATPGVHASLGFELGWLRVEAFGGTFLPQRVPNARLSLDFDVGLRPCLLLGTSRVRPMICAALALGRSSVVADVNTPLPASSTFAAVYAGAGLTVRLFWRVSLLAHLEAGVPLVRTLYYLTTGEPLYVAPLFAARGELGLQVRVW